MFVRTREDISGTEREMVRSEGNLSLRSLRMLTKADGCGFSLSDAYFSAGFSIDLWYKNHVEANFIVSGVIQVDDLRAGKSWDLEGGALYVVGPRDRHRLTAKTDVHLLSVFCPGVLGNERHDADGVFPPTGDIPPAWQGPDGHTMYVKLREDIRAVGIKHVGTEARRYLTQDDGCGFTLSTARPPAGSSANLWYRNHVEANFILEGEGSVEDLSTGEKWELSPGSLYVVGPRDRHRMSADTDVYLMAIFNPPLVGDETHDEQGGYPPTGSVPEGWGG